MVGAVLWSSSRQDIKSGKEINSVKYQITKYFVYIDNRFLNILRDEIFATSNEEFEF